MDCVTLLDMGRGFPTVNASAPTAGDEWNIAATTNSDHSMAIDRLALQSPDPANRLAYWPEC